MDTFPLTGGYTTYAVTQNDPSKPEYVTDSAASGTGWATGTKTYNGAISVDAYGSHQDTLVIVMADHGHTSQIIPNDVKSPGQTATLITHDNALMTLNYATNPAGTSQEHTGTQVRIAGYGPQAANVVGVTDQTDLFHTISRALSLR